MKIFNIIAADLCWVVYMYCGIKFDEWKKRWYVALLFVLNLWAAAYLN